MVDAVTTSESGSDMHPKLLGALRPDGERQSLEFKTSLSERKELVQTAVAFANGQGGDIFVGVRPNGEPRGVDVGANTVENLANELAQCIYPPLPMHIDQVMLPDQYACSKPLIWIEVPRDTPPVVGAYLASESPLRRGEPVSTAELQAYRRVGRTNQKVDFMWLRPHNPTDPRLFMSKSNRTGDAELGMKEFGFTVWSEAGSGTARDVRFSSNIDFVASPSWSPFLPRSDRVPSVNAVFYCSGDMHALSSITISTTCLDDWGCRWEFSYTFGFVPASGGVLDFDNGVGFSRRIVEFPWSIGASGT